MGLRCTFHEIDSDFAAHMAAGGRDDRKSGASLCIDKAWSGIHFLLTGEGEASSDNPSPEHFILNGTLMEDVSEHAAIHTADQVAAFSALLSQSSDDDLLRRRDSERMEELGVYSSTGESWYVDYLRDYLVQLRQFITDASARGSGMLTLIC